jgi:hypothetical protein
MRYTLLGEAVRREGRDLVDLIILPTAPSTAKFSEDNVVKARTFVVNDAKANALICRRVSPPIASNIPAKHDDSSRYTWRHLNSTYQHASQFQLHSRISALRLQGLRRGTLPR